MREMLWPGAYIVRVTIPESTREASSPPAREAPEVAGPPPYWLSNGDYPAVAVEFSSSTITWAGVVWVLTNRGLECMELSNALTTVEEFYSVRLLLAPAANGKHLAGGAR